jgi:hypothetical protein
VKLPVFNDPVTGEPSLSATLVFVTFTVVAIKWLLGNVSVFGHTLASVTTAEIDAWLTPVFFLYFGRKATTATEKVASMKREPT